MEEGCVTEQRWWITLGLGEAGVRAALYRLKFGRNWNETRDVHVVLDSTNQFTQINNTDLHAIST